MRFSRLLIVHRGHSIGSGAGLSGGDSGPGQHRGRWLRAVLSGAAVFLSMASHVAHRLLGLGVQRVFSARPAALLAGLRGSELRNFVGQFCDGPKDLPARARISETLFVFVGGDHTDRAAPGRIGASFFSMIAISSGIVF